MEIRRLMALRVLTMCLAISGTHVQASSFRAQVPFAFVVGSQTFPAGSYIVQRLFGKIFESTGVVVIKTSDRRIYRAVITHLKVDGPKDRVGVSKLSFTTFRGQHYLSRIWVAGEKTADQLSTPADSTSLEALPVTEVKLLTLR
jgi:hypothetical protein